MLSTQARELYRRIGFLGLCFAVTFTGFNVALSYVTTIFKGPFGYTTLSITYLIYAFSSLATPSLNRLLARSQWVGEERAEKVALVGASIFYSGYILALAVESRELFLVMSVLLGGAAGVMWLNQGVYVTRMVHHYREEHDQLLARENNEQSNLGVTGKNGGGVDKNGVKEDSVIGGATGLFFAVYNVNGIVGNVIALVILSVGAGFRSLIWSMLGVCFFGTILLLFAAPIPSISKSQTDILKEKEQHAGSNQWDEIKKFARNPVTWMLTPYMFTQGLNIAFDFANFPTYVTFVSSLADETQQTANIAIVFLVYGVGCIIGSFLWGRVYDRSHARLLPLIISHLLLVLLNNGLLVGAVVVGNYQSGMSMLIAVGFIFGLIDYCTNAIINNSNSKCYQGLQVSLSFAWYRFCFCIAFSIGTAISSVVAGVDQYSVSTEPSTKFGFLVIVGLNVGLMLVCFICGLILDRQQSNSKTKVAPVEEVHIDPDRSAKI